MANSGEIIIKIVREDGVTEKKVDVTGKKQKDKVASNLETAAITTVIQKAANTIKELGVSQVKFQTHRYFTMTDDYLGLQNLQIGLNIINKAYGAGMSIAGGATVAGPWGAAIMAVVELGKVGFDIYHAQSEQNFRLKQMDAQLDFNRQRAGYSLTAGTAGDNR